MLRLIINTPNGTVMGIRELIPGSAILTVLDNVGRELREHVWITLWCDENGNMGAREYNAPLGGYDRDRVITWARANAMELIEATRKIQAIKLVRTAWPLLGLKETKELVEEITPYWVYN